MAESIGDDVLHAILPSGRSIYDLITADDLHRIRAILDPLTLRHRQSIVCQKVCNKTLLGHACELRLRRIVKYLLDECEADITERYTHGYMMVSPLRIAFNNLDVSMLILFVNRGVFAVDANEVMSCSADALKKKYFCIFSILSDYADTIESLDVNLQSTYLLSWLSTMCLNNAYPFLRASASGEIRRMKGLLANCMNPKVIDYSEENALCMTIMNKKSNAEDFLLNYRVFSIKDHVKALELCGAKFLVFLSDISNAQQCWRKSIRIRTENFLGVSDKFENTPKTDLGIEFNCDEHLDKLMNNEDTFYIQALIVFLRLLPPSSQLLHDAFVIVAKHPVFYNDLLQAIKVLAELAEFPYFPNNELCSPMRTATECLEPLFYSHFYCDLSNMGDILLALRDQIDVITKCTWKLLLTHQGEFYSVVYIELLTNLLKKIIALDKFGSCIDDNTWIKDGISQILQWHPDPYPTTLLHLSIEEPNALPVLPLILSWSDDVNCRDAKTNTPMHTVALMQSDNDHILHLLKLLADAGGHIDAINEYGITPFMTLKFNGVLRNPLQFMSLKCLAARRIPETIISFEEYPENVVSLIKLHRK